MRYTGPKNRLSRREGIDLGMKTPGSKSHSNLIKRLNIIPGQHGMRRRRKITDYGLQLREKQKLKRIYGITETQMKNYFERANRMVGNTAEILTQFLESRLDNVVFKLGLAPTRASARQLATHGHILVNDRKLTIPSAQVAEGDVIRFKKEKSPKIPYVAKMLEKKDLIIPSWLKRKGPVGKVLSLPSLESFRDDVNVQLVIEFYSR